MLRALSTLIGGAEDVLEPLVQRYCLLRSELIPSFNQQHRLLVNFYYECSNLRYLTSLISVPRLPQVSSHSSLLMNIESTQRI
jgi:huntingtin-interacting protein 1-related protein